MWNVAIYYITQTLAMWNVFTILHRLHSDNYILDTVCITDITRRSLLPCGIINALLLQQWWT